uniref:DUF569 domain-containing protein n=1 Tax=Ananas comosus var. bracteatus TaxID=296719 RepID=A0A6V7PKS5_ANACO|nr:unnamed protein product [Ananas comosus var. bracteatus]
MLMRASNEKPEFFVTLSGIFWVPGTLCPKFLPALDVAAAESPREVPARQRERAARPAGPRRDIPNAHWSVDPVPPPASQDARFVRLRGVSGRYLTASNEPFLLAAAGSKVVAEHDNDVDDLTAGGGEEEELVGRRQVAAGDAAQADEAVVLTGGRRDGVDGPVGVRDAASRSCRTCCSFSYFPWWLHSRTIFAPSNNSIETR